MTNQVAVGFDTFKNTGDPSVPYVGIFVNGAAHATANSSTVTFTNGSTWSSWISYSGTTLAVYLSTSFAQPSTPAVSATVNIFSVIGQTTAFFGIGGGTSTNSEVAKIYNWEFKLNGTTQFRYGWDHCLATPCLNGGTCLDGLTSSSCECVPGYVGTQCEVLVNNCVADICQNGATCINGVNEYTCECVAGFTGINCQASVRLCDTDPCTNGGTCVNIANDYLCLCPPNYGDATCSTRKRCPEILYYFYYYYFDPPHSPQQPFVTRELSSPLPRCTTVASLGNTFPSRR